MDSVSLWGFQCPWKNTEFSLMRLFSICLSRLKTSGEYSSNMDCAWESLEWNPSFHVSLRLPGVASDTVLWPCFFYDKQQGSCFPTLLCNNFICMAPLCLHGTDWWLSESANHCSPDGFTRVPLLQGKPTSALLACICAHFGNSMLRHTREEIEVSKSLDLSYIF